MLRRLLLLRGSVSRSGHSASAACAVQSLSTLLGSPQSQENILPRNFQFQPAVHIPWKSINSCRHHANLAFAGSNADEVEEGPNFDQLTREMQQSVDHLSDNLASLRFGRASPGLLDNIKVDVYGDKLPFKSVAACTVREAQLLAVTVFDPETIDSVAKAIGAAPLGLNPRVEGSDILVPVPRPDADSLKGLKKMVQENAEKAKQAIRRVRKSAMDDCKAFKSKDEQRRREKQVQETVDDFVLRIDAIIGKKTEELNAA